MSACSVIRPQKVNSVVPRHSWMWPFTRLLHFLEFKYLHSDWIMMTSSNGNIVRYWPFVRGIHRWPVNSPHKDQWREALMFSLICVWTNGWANKQDAGDLRRHRAHHDVTAMRVWDFTLCGRSCLYSINHSFKWSLSVIWAKNHVHPHLFFLFNIED